MYKIGVNIFDLIHTTFSFRKSLICLSFILFISGVSAQKINKKWIISAGINAVDIYPTGINENNQYFPQGEILNGSPLPIYSVKTRLDEHLYKSMLF